MSITGEAPIHKAVLSVRPQKGVALTTIITDCNANLDTLDSNGWTALHHASYNGDLASAETLLKKGAQVSAYSNLGKTALHFAAMRNHTNVINLLIKNKASLEAEDSQECTALHLACKKGALEATSMLLAYQSNIYALDERKWTPLHYAAYNGYPRVCKKLLTWSVDRDPKLRDARNSQNRVAFNVCKNPETKLGFRIIWRSARDGDLDMVRILIREGQNPDEATQEFRNTPLHLAAQNGHFLIVRLLVDLDAAFDLKNYEGKSALVLAEESLDKEIAKQGGNKKRKNAVAAKPVKGSLWDRLEATVDFLYQKEGRNREEEQKKAGQKAKLGAQPASTTAKKAAPAKKSAAAAADNDDDDYVSDEDFDEEDVVPEVKPKAVSKARPTGPTSSGAAGRRY